MYIEPDPPRRSRFVIATIAVSVLFHAGVSAGLHEMSPPKPQAVSYHVSFDPAPPPPPPPPPPPEEKPKPKPKAPEPEPAPKVQEPPKAAEPVKEVFGVTKDSVAEDSSFAVRVGNTLMAEEYARWYTPAHILGGWNQRLQERNGVEAAQSLPPVKEIAASEPTTDQEQSTESPLQLNLF